MYTCNIRGRIQRRIMMDFFPKYLVIPISDFRVAFPFSWSFVTCSEFFGTLVPVSCGRAETNMAVTRLCRFWFPSFGCLRNTTKGLRNTGIYNSQRQIYVRVMLRLFSRLVDSRLSYNCFTMRQFIKYDVSLCSVAGCRCIETFILYTGGSPRHTVSIFHYFCESLW